MSYNFDAVSYANTGKRLKNYQCGDVSVTKNADGSITFSANGGQSSVTLSPNEIKGLGIKKIEINTDNHLICTLDDNTTIDAGVLPSGSSTGGTTKYTDLTNKPSINGVELSGNKSLSDLGIANYDDTQVKKDIADLKSDKQDKTDNTLETIDKTVAGAINEVNGNQLDTVGFSSDYKNIILNRKNGLNPYTIPISAIIHNAKLIELNDVDSTNIGDGKTLVYDGATKKHKYVSSTGTDELVKMDSTTDAKHLSDLIDKSTVVNDNGVLKVKKLDGQEVTIAEINYLKGLTMNVMDLVKMFSNGGVKIINTPVSTHADLLAYDKTGLIDGISYLVYVLADETHNNAKTTYLIDKTSSTPTYFGFSGEHRDFTANPIDLANEVTGKLATSNIDVDALWSLLTINDTYKTLTTKDEVFGTHGAKAMYDELVAGIGKKANATDLTTHTNDTDIHITSSERTKWNKVDNKIDKTDITTIIDGSSTNTQVPTAKSVFDNIKKNGLIWQGKQELQNSQESTVFNYCKSNFIVERICGFRLEPKDGSGYFSSASVTIIYCLSSVNYGWILGISDKSGIPMAIIQMADKLTKWQRVCTTSVADVPYTNITSKLKNCSAGAIGYSVIDGICRVKINGLKPNTQSVEILATGILPNPDPIHNGHFNVMYTTGNMALFIIYNTSTDGVRLQSCNSTIAGDIYCTLEYPVKRS